MIQALPYVADASEKNAISLVSAYYANRLGKQIMSTSPSIKQTIEQWKKETGKENVNDVGFGEEPRTQVFDT